MRYSGELALATGLLVFCAGCGGRSTPNFVPPEQAARTALELSLNAWREGQYSGRVTSTSPAIELVDTHRRKGQRLQHFEILGEVPGDSPRCFAVRLNLANPREEHVARYVVIGIDPLWVLRHEDYEMIAHWDCNFEEESKANQAAARK